MKYLITTLFIFMYSLLFSQIGEVPVVVHNGVRCYEHTVKKKQTAYGISKLYHVDINKIFEVNPSAQKGLNIGEKLYIPLPQSEQTLPPSEPSTSLPKEESIQKEGENANSTEIIHTVQKGETLWSIARKYGVKPQAVLDANLDKGNNLNIGDKIKIPITEAEKKDETTPIVDIPKNPLENPGDSIILHKVKKGETLYGIASLYKIPQQDILSANPELKDGLKKGMKIRIPLKRKVITVQPKEPVEEALPVDSNQVVSNLPASDTTTFLNQKKDVYNIAIMLPFYLEENRKRKESCPPFGECLTYPKTFRAINFYSGMMIAIDSMRKAGMNLNVNVYDTQNDTAVVNQILKSPELKKTDLIFGPLYVREIKPVTKFAKENHIQMIIPVPVSNKALFNNPFVSKLTASKYTQVEYLANYLAQKYYDENVILVRNKYNKKDEVLFHLFKRKFNEALQQYPNRALDSLKIAASVGTSSKLTYVQQHMKEDKKNVIVDLSTDLSHVSNLFTKLTATMNSNPYNRYQVELYGMEDWKKFETINEKYKNRFHLHIITPGYIDYYSPEAFEFRKKYRAKFGTDPDKFAYMGFDAVFSNLKGLFLFGKQYPKYYDQLITKGLFTTTKYKQNTPKDGFENKNVDIIEYDNYHLKKVNP